MNGLQSVIPAAGPWPGSRTQQAPRKMTVSSISPTTWHFFFMPNLHGLQKNTAQTLSLQVALAHPRASSQLSSSICRLPDPSSTPHLTKNFLNGIIPHASLKLHCTQHRALRTVGAQIPVSLINIVPLEIYLVTQEY